MTATPEAIFVPGRLAFGGDEQGGWCERALGTYLKPGQQWQTPPVRLTAGKPARENLDDYCQANAITRPLREKLAPELFEEFRRPVLVKYRGTAREQIESLDRLPVPTLIQFTDYLKLDGQEPRAVSVLDGAIRFRLPGTPPSSGEMGRFTATVRRLWHAEVTAR